eukprot:jgi/Botrbrau1/16352/Bobra.178_1s0005.1
MYTRVVLSGALACTTWACVDHLATAKAPANAANIPLHSARLIPWAPPRAPSPRLGHVYRGLLSLRLEVEGRSPGPTGTVPYWYRVGTTDAAEWKHW